MVTCRHVQASGKELLVNLAAVVPSACVHRKGMELMVCDAPYFSDGEEQRRNHRHTARQSHRVTVAPLVQQCRYAYTSIDFIEIY